MDRPRTMLPLKTEEDLSLNSDEKIQVPKTDQSAATWCMNPILHILGSINPSFYPRS